MLGLNKQFRSVGSLSDYGTWLIRSGQLDRALRLVNSFVEQIFTEPLCTSQVIGSAALDNLCQEVGKRNLASINRSMLVTDAHLEQPVYVYIVTRLQCSGGHTRLIEDLIKARPLDRHVVLSTELSGRSDDAYLKGELAGWKNVSFESALRHDSYQQRLMWLQRRLLEISPEKIYLFNHHQDSVAIAAVQPEMGFKVSFYHHGDHHLCLGVFLSYVEHIDPHPMGYHDCKGLGINSRYVPLTLEDKGARPAGWPFIEGGMLTTCTAARSNKIEIPYFVNYLDVVPQLLKGAGGRHVHIGRLTPWALFKIRRGLKHLGVPEDRFVYIPWVPSVWKALHEHRVDLYVASFPYGGGLTLIEAMGAGVPVALHQHVSSRVLSSVDLAYPEAFSWQMPAELVDFCMSVTPEILRHQGEQARAQYMAYHRKQILEDILSSGGNLTISPPDLSDKYRPRRDEFAAWLESQVSIRHLAYRSLYRLARSVRGKFF